MKQLFVDILTKVTPKSITNGEIDYKIENSESSDPMYVCIDWVYVKPTNVPKLEFVLPFSKHFSDFIFTPDTEYTQKVYRLFINNVCYFMDFNPVEICEIDRIVYNIFANYQTSKIQAIQHYLNLDNQNDPKTTEQKFEEAQEAVANNE